MGLGGRGLLGLVLCLGGCVGAPDAACATATCEGAHCLMVTELMASESSLLDEDGRASDWIEIHNASERALSLAGYSLTDDAAAPRQWRLPSRCVPAGGYLVVFASGRDRAPTEGELHASFALSRQGEYLALVDASGRARSEYSPSYPAQQDGVSYGLAFAGGVPQPTSQRYFAIPTPGGPNSEGVATITEPPVFSVAGTTFSGALDVELTPATAGAVIRYTLDGSDPQESSPAYSEPVQVDRTLVLKARAYADGALPSRIVEERYVEIEDDLAAFSSDLPIVLVHTMGPQITPEGYIDGVASFVPPGADARARPRDEPAEHARVGLRHRGMSSVYFPKRSFTMELRDDGGRDREAPLFGMPADSDWVLYGPYSDKSLLRNYLFYGWSRAIGRYAPRVQFVEAFVHEGTGPISRVDYEGLYAVVERVTVGEQRVDIEPLEPEDGAEPEVSGGYLLARDWVDPGEVELTTSMGVPFVIREPDEDDVTDAQRQWLLAWLGEMESVLASSRRDDPALGYRQYLDEGSFIDHHLLIEMARNVDGLRLSAFMYKEREGPLHVGPVWDCNTCFGNIDFHEGQYAEGWYHAPFESDDGVRTDLDCSCPTRCGDPSCVPTWWAHLFASPGFVARYRARWAELRAGPLRDETLMADIDAGVELVREAQARNFARWTILGIRVWPNFYVGATWEDEVQYLRDWLLDRVHWMDEQLLGP